MALTSADVHTLLTTLVFPSGAPTETLGTAIYATQNNVAAIQATLAGMQATMAKLADPAAIAAAVVAQLGTGHDLTAEQVTDAVKAALEQVTLSVTAQPATV